MPPPSIRRRVVSRASPAGALRSQTKRRIRAPSTQAKPAVNPARSLRARPALADSGRPARFSPSPSSPRAQHKAHRRSRHSVLARSGLGALSLSNGLVQPGSRCALRRSRTLRVRLLLHSFWGFKISLFQFPMSSLLSRLSGPRLQASYGSELFRAGNRY